MSKNAVSDIKILIERLNDLSEVAETFATKEVLDSQVKELTKSVSNLKTQFTKASSDFSDIKQNSIKLLSEQKNSIESVEKNASEILGKAREEASKIISEAEGKAEEINRSASVDLKTTADNIESKRKELYTVASEVDANITRLNNAKQELIKLREKL